MEEETDVKKQKRETPDDVLAGQNRMLVVMEEIQTGATPAFIKCSIREEKRTE